MDFAPYQSSPPEASRPFSPPRTSPSPRPSLQQRPFTRSPPVLQHPQPQRGWSRSFTQDEQDDDLTLERNGRYEQQHRFAQQGFGGGIADGWGRGMRGGGGGVAGADANANAESGRGFGLDEFNTSLGMRLDYEAAAAYVVFPPVGAILLLILESKSDYVRFHAWQSSLLFTVLFILLLLASGFPFLWWLLFLGDIGLVALLVMRAWRDADTLERYEIPIVGQLASRFVDDE